MTLKDRFEALQRWSCIEGSLGGPDMDFDNNFGEYLSRDDVLALAEQIDREQATVQDRVAVVTKALEGMTDDQRLAAFGVWCLHCGGRAFPHGHRRCQCSNDE